MFLLVICRSLPPLVHYTFSDVRKYWDSDIILRAVIPTWFAPYGCKYPQITSADCQLYLRVFASICSEQCRNYSPSKLCHCLNTYRHHCTLKANLPPPGVVLYFRSHAWVRMAEWVVGRIFQEHRSSIHRSQCSPF